MDRRQHAPRALTLIELIVVLIIVGVLGGIAALTYDKFIASSRKEATLAVSAQVVTLVGAYGQLHDLAARTVFESAPDRAAALADVPDDVFIGEVTTTPEGGAQVVVYAGPDATAPHFCVVDVSGFLPVLRKDTCR